MADSLTVKQFKEMLKKGQIHTGAKGRLVMDEDVEIPEPKKELSNYIFIPGDVPSGKNSYQIRIKFSSPSNWKIKSRGAWKPAVPFISKSNLAHRYQKKTAKYFKMYKHDFQRMTFGKKYPVFVEFYIVRRTKSRFDFNNIIQLIQDSMVEYGWIPDDSMNYLLPLMPFKEHYSVDKTNPGVYIRVKDNPCQK